MSIPILSILVSTINDRIAEVPHMLLPPSEQICYVISFQYTDPMFLDMVPEVLKRRSDVRIFPSPGAGLSVNRNNALRNCATELAVIADDDVRYSQESLDALIYLFERHPEVDIFCLQAITPDGKAFKDYSPRPFDYKCAPRGAYYTSFEIALRAGSSLPAFDTRFGLGATYLSCGEEEVFLFQASCMGATVQYYPQVLCTVPTRETTGARFATDRKVRRSKGAVLCLLHSLPSALLRITKTAILRRREISWLTAWKDMFDGLRYVLKHPLNEGTADPIPIEFQPLDLQKLPGS